ncbi:26S proteasome non-ATPase regulatory subunit 4-like, partial [Saccoglossus kowalevskii]|uniref:26S proteasome non-ATPase regulatory subunit 4-like n=1 Tax=Saccoglossus kowalevskii TaxID=10224 RepID=A0ABM0GPR0_SACKO
LALKHRQGRNHRMRIVIFVGSPIEEEDKDLVKLSKKLKKEKVNVDVVNFGEDALRISMEEQRQRQDEDTRKVPESAEPSTEEQKPVKAPGDSEEALLEQAIAMSMQQPPSEVAESVPETPAPDFSSMSEEEQIAYAMQMSLQHQMSDMSDLANPLSADSPMDTSEATEQPDPDDDYSEVMSDPAFLQSVLENLPGVDPSSEAIRNAMGTLTQQQKSEDKEKKKEDKDKK